MFYFPGFISMPNATVQQWTTPLIQYNTSSILTGHNITQLHTLRYEHSNSSPSCVSCTGTVPGTCMTYKNLTKRSHNTLTLVCMTNKGCLNMQQHRPFHSHTCQRHGFICNQNYMQNFVKLGVQDDKIKTHPVTNTINKTCVTYKIRHISCNCKKVTVTLKWFPGHFMYLCWTK
jgi:hypothetical protein